MTSRNEASDSLTLAPKPPFAAILAARLAGILASGLATLLLYQLVFISRADWLSKQRTRESILAAIHLFPDNSVFYRDWAEIEPADAVVALRQAVAVNPLYPDIRLELAMATEKAGYLDEAEASLIKAVALERTGAPRGVLAEFYFRHREVEKFWPVVRDALDHSFYDFTTLFEDCWALSPDSSLILERAIPNRASVLDAYLAFLLARNRLDAAQPLVDRIMATSDGAGAEKTLFNYCDRLIENNSADRAVPVWNWLCKRKFLPYDTLDPVAGRSLTNGNFALPPLSKGFDWRPSPNGGLYVEFSKAAAALELTFTGKQPEQCEILSQYVPLQPNRKYRLHVRYTTSDIAQESGLTWRVMLMPENKDILNNSGTLPGGSGEQAFSQSFVTPAGTTMGRLVLSYERVKGTVRIEGSAELRQVDLTFEPQ